MNNEAPASTAALQARIADLEQQLKLSDEGVSRLAERCLGLEQEVQSYLAAHPQNEKHTDSPALLQPTLYFDAGFGFSEKDTLTAPDYEVDELTGVVIATFELPVTARALRLDPGELPCCITNLSFSDDRVLCRPVNGLTLPSDSTLFLDRDPNYLLDGVTHFPAGMKLGVSYHYCPLETLADKPLFNTVLEGLRFCQKTRDSEAQHIAGLNDQIAAQQQAIAALQQEPNEALLAHALTVIRRRMREHGQVILAVDMPQDQNRMRQMMADPATPMQIQAMQTADGKAWWVAFTGFGEELRGADQVKSTFLADLEQIFRTALTVNEIEGIILNPWNRTLMLNKNLIRIMLGDS